MEEIQKFFQTYTVDIILVIAVILIILLITNLIVLFKTNKMKKNYNKLMNGREGVNISELLTQTGMEINNLRNKVIINKQRTDEIDAKLAFAIQKVGFVRYNAFAEMGSDLSFSIAMLDGFQNGFVVTSIYGRDYASTYGKPIKGGKSVYPLSVEEMQAIDRAMLGQVLEKTI